MLRGSVRVSDYGRIIAVQLGCNLFCLDKIVLANIATQYFTIILSHNKHYVSFNHRGMAVTFYTPWIGSGLARKDRINL